MRVTDTPADLSDMPADLPDMRVDMPDMSAQSAPEARMFTERAELVTIIGDDAGRLDIVMISMQSPPCIIQHTWLGQGWTTSQVECGQELTTWRRPMLWWEGDTLNMLVVEAFPQPRVRHLIQPSGAGMWVGQGNALVHPSPTDEGLAVTIDATATHTSAKGTWLAQAIAREDGDPEVLLTYKGAGQRSWSPPTSMIIEDFRYCPDLQVQRDALTDLTHALVLCVDALDDTHIFHLVHKQDEGWTRREERPPLISKESGPSGLLATIVQGDLWVIGAGEQGKLTMTTLPDGERGVWSEAVVIDARPSSGGHPRLVPGTTPQQLKLVYTVGTTSQQRAWVTTTRDSGESWEDARKLEMNTFNVTYDLWTSSANVTHMILSDADVLLRYGVLGVDF